MATLDSILTFTGKLGNVIAYKRDGQHFLRSRPAYVRQTEHTRRAAQRFGAASRKGALIRQAILPNLDIHCHGSLVNRLNSTLVQAGRNNHAGLAGFQFNPHANARIFFRMPPVFTSDGELRIPAQELPAQGEATRMEVKLIATRIDFINRRVTGSAVDVVNIDLKAPFQGASLSASVPGKGPVVVTLQVRLFKGGAVLHHRKYKAADVLAVMIEAPAPAVPGKAKPREQRGHALPAGSHQPGAGQTLVQRE